MKKANLILLFALATFSSFGQKIRFTDSTNVWEILNIVTDATTGPFAGYELLNDTGSLIFDSKKYRRISLSYVIEDTINNKVFIRYFNTMTGSLDTSDELLYDYNWAVGDTVRYFHPGWHSSVYWVAAIDSTQINSIWYKVWHFEGSGPSYNVIEGIGCTNKFDYPVNPYPPFEFSSQLICFSNQRATYPLSNPISSWGVLGDIYLNNTTSCDNPLGIKDVSKHKTELYPNPIDNTTKIAFPYNVSGSLIILNVIGQAVVNLPFTNKNELLIGDKITSPGLYYYRMTDEQGGKVFSGKFVKQ